MIERIGHVKNPLSVIAIFAGIAEVSGTLVLPHLEAPVQETYIWFLMLFPGLLVLLFFLVLLKNPDALYAPSDYADEKNYMATRVRPASMYSINLKRQEFDSDFLSEAAATNSATTDLEDQQDNATSSSQDHYAETPPPPSPPSPLEPPKSEAQKAGTEQVSGVGTPTIKMVPSWSSATEQLENLALHRLSSEKNILLAREVEVAGIPGIVFDGAERKQDGLTLVEAFVVRADTPLKRIREMLDKVSEFSDSLSFEYRRKLKLILVVIEDDATSLASRRKMTTHLNLMISAARINIEVVRYSASSLSIQAE